MIENDDAAAQAAAQAATSNEQVQAIDMFTAPELEPSRLRLLPSRGSSSGGTSAVPSPKPSQTTCHLGFSVPPVCQPQSFHLALHLHRCASNSNCSSSCSNACPRLNMKASWVRSSTPSFRCHSIHLSIYPSIYPSVHVYLHYPRAIALITTWRTHRGAPSRARVAGGGSGSRRKDHWHAARSGRAPDRTPQRAPDRRPHYLPRQGALDVARQPLALAHPPGGVPRCRSYWTASKRRKGCWSVHISLAATDPTPAAPSQLTVLRHVPARTQY